MEGLLVHSEFLQREQVCLHLAEINCSLMEYGMSCAHTSCSPIVLVAIHGYFISTSRAVCFARRVSKTEVWYSAACVISNKDMLKTLLLKVNSLEQQDLWPSNLATWSTGLQWSTVHCVRPPTVNWSALLLSRPSLLVISPRVVNKKHFTCERIQRWFACLSRKALERLSLCDKQAGDGEGAASISIVFWMEVLISFGEWVRRYLFWVPLSPNRPLSVPDRQFSSIQQGCGYSKGSWNPFPQDQRLQSNLFCCL